MTEDMQVYRSTDFPALPKPEHKWGFDGRQAYGNIRLLKD